MFIVVTTNEGKTFSLETESTDIKAKVQDKVMQVIVKSTKGKTITLEVETSRTINSVIATMEDDEEVLPEDHRLLFEVDDSSVGEEQPTDWMRINVQNTYADERFTINTKSSDTIAIVKEKIEEMKGLPPWQQRLIYAGKQLDDDLATLEELDVWNDYTLFLVPRRTKEGRSNKRIRCDSP